MFKLFYVVPYVFIYTIYYTNLPIKLEELLMLIYLGYYFLNEKILFFKINYKLLFLIMTLGLISIFKVIGNGYPLIRCLEQIILLLVMFLGFDKFFENYGYEKLFDIYLKITCFISILGIFQFIIYLFFKIDIFPYPIGCNSRVLPTFGSDLARIRSIAYEPGWLAQTMLPACIYSIENIIRNKKTKINYLIILLAFFMTQASAAFIVVPIYFFITRFKKPALKNILKVSIAIPLGLFLTQSIWWNKYIDTIQSFKSLKTGIFENINASSFAILSNLYVALNNDNLFFGTGLGTHPYSYLRNFKNLETGVYYFYGLNAMDAYSLATRIVSEMGVVILALFIIFIIVYLNFDDSNKGIINRCALAGILSFFLRGGLYTKFGTAFIIILFFKTSIKNKGVEYDYSYND